MLLPKDLRVIFDPASDYLGGGPGYLLVLAIVVPVAGVLISFVLGGRNAERTALLITPLCAAIALAIVYEVWRTGKTVTYVLGGWQPPLGITLRADGISAVMLATTAIIITATGLFARADFQTPQRQSEARAPVVFWTLLLAAWAALNTVFLGGDLFNLYVALELMTFAAVPLVCLSGRAETITAALRYLVFALVGSIFYLLGTALLYGAYGTLDIILLHDRVRAEPAVWMAIALITAGLLAKTALFPLHFWLPPAHAGAPPAASAILSALVVKASYFLIVRTWFDVLPAGVRSGLAAQMLGAMGAAAILFGGIIALRQARLKLLIAYSTVSQIGYLFLMFPLIVGFDAQSWSNVAWTGGWIQLVSHAFAKAAMFMAAGLIAETLGHDRIADLNGIGRLLPVTVLAFAIAGISLMGVPPSGGFVAKWLLLTASVQEHQWWYALVVVLGGLIAGGYVIQVVTRMIAYPAQALTLSAKVSRRREAIPLALAVCAILLGLLPLQPSDFLQIGRPPALGSALP
jgi:formate hydrogenlyase subunit 3/multisubunit Na+/H+ antiporter MnhD subunit